MSSTESISSSILNYRRENGRTYHRYNDGKYNLPNNEVENERLDFQHHQWLLTLGDGLGLAPPNKSDSGVKRVLDLGCGTGIWVVTGIDLSPIQPDFTGVLPNSAPFDYIHTRAMNFSSFENLKAAMTNVGFVDVRLNRFKWPINQWPKDKKHKEISTLFTRTCGWTKKEVGVLIAKARKDLVNPTVHAYTLV
ncbi:S-adenosyl-L-methionine-dependent methyltransferase [Dactylonectria estremocensis]|uniref:S-adenosyl-L-methionine-dependent methyltransferase n=1 Tax=Dactylonectria estremocensis TaxID=1079267 RepID=A0A9P9ISH3_9HYPO|nr:S-adenosyl-L-methionine-dependent methyltransferase [Dactylonectria estremocensis]